MLELETKKGLGKNLRENKTLPADKIPAKNLLGG